MSKPSRNHPHTVFVVHGRNSAAREAMFDFLRSIGLKPLEWSQAVRGTGHAAPYIGDVLDHAFEVAQAVVVLLTPDEIAYLRREFAAGDDDPEHAPAPQGRPNVLFEAGMAFGRHPTRTILVELGEVRPFSDVAGRHVIRIDNSPEKRQDLADRLRTAGCEVDLSGRDWLRAGDLTPPPPPGGGLPLGRRVPSPKSTGIRVDANYTDRAKRGGLLKVTNYSTVAIHNLDIEIPSEAGPSFKVHTSTLPLKKLPPGKSVSLVASRVMGPGADHFDIIVTGHTPDGDPVREEAFVSLVG